MNNYNSSIQNKAVAIVIALFCIYTTEVIGQNKSLKYFSFKLKSPVYLSSINSDTLKARQKLSVNYSLGFGVNTKISEKAYFNTTLNIGLEKFKVHISPTSSINKIKSFTVDVDLKYGIALHPTSILFIGFSTTIIQPYIVSSESFGATDITYKSAPDFSPNFDAHFDIRPNVSLEFNPFKSEKVKLLIGTEFSILKQYLYFNIITRNDITQNYKLHYSLIQPFICLNYYL